MSIEWWLVLGGAVYLTVFVLLPIIWLVNRLIALKWSLPAIGGMVVLNLVFLPGFWYYLGVVEYLEFKQKQPRFSPVLWSDEQ